MIAYEPLVGELDQQVEGVLVRQVLDADSPDCGGFVDWAVVGRSGRVFITIGAVPLDNLRKLLKNNKLSPPSPEKFAPEFR